MFVCVQNAQLEKQYQDLLREIDQKEQEHTLEVNQLKDEMNKLRAEMEAMLVELQVSQASTRRQSVIVGSSTSFTPRPRAGSTIPLPPPPPPSPFSCPPPPC